MVLYKKGQSSLYLLRTVRSSEVQGLLKIFFDTVVSSTTDRKRLNKLIRRVSSFLGCP